MSLNFQNRIVFPAPETSYTTESAYQQVIYVPRNIMDLVDNKLDLLKHDEGNLDAPPEFAKPAQAEEESKEESTTTPTEIQEETVQSEPEVKVPPIQPLEPKP